MIRFENTETFGWEHAVRGTRNLSSSWNKSDSFECHTGQCYDCEWSDEHPECAEEASKRNGNEFRFGPSDYKLTTSLRTNDTKYKNFLRMVTVYVDVIAPLYWWKEFDACETDSTTIPRHIMHKITAKEFELSDFSHERLIYIPAEDHEQEDNMALIIDGDDGYSDEYDSMDFLGLIIDVLNHFRDLYLETEDDQYWWQIVQLLPTSYNQRRTVMLNYDILANIYKSQKNCQTDEWQEFWKWVAEYLPYSELITDGERYLNGQ